MALSDDEIQELDPWQKKVLALLTYMSGADGRDVNHLQVLTWADLLRDEKRLTYEDSMAAIRRFYKTETRRMTPADLIKGAKKVQADRADRKPVIEPRRGGPPPPEVKALLDQLGSSFAMPPSTHTRKEITHGK